MIDAGTLLNKEANILLIGEVHGIKENVALLRSFVRAYLKEARDYKLVLAFEWPHELTAEIDTYLQGQGSLRWKKWSFRTFRDGRISREHIHFLGWLKKINRQLPGNRRILTRCFDVAEKGWNKRDKKMAETLLQRGASKNTMVIAMMGNLHARKKPFSLDGVRYVPLGYHMPRNAVVSIKLEYLAGYFYNISLKKIPPRRKSPTTIMLGLKKINRKFGYDYTYFFERAHPVEPLP